MPLQVTMTTEQMVKLHPEPLTEGGAPAEIDGVPEYLLDDGDVIFAPVDGEPNAMWARAGAIGIVSTVRVRMDADLGEGMKPIEDTCVITVTHADAAAVGLVADAPVLKF